MKKVKYDIFNGAAVFSLLFAVIIGATLIVGCSGGGGSGSPENDEISDNNGDCGEDNSALTWYKDIDNDGYSDGTTQIQCLQPDGFKLEADLTAISGDCDDMDNQTYPNSGGICDNNIDLEGWTVFTPSADSRIMYVSASGDDLTGEEYSSVSSEIGSDPFEPSDLIKPFATYAAAYAHTRNGYPDWILIKRGDTFYETIGTQIRDGRNTNERFLIASYGTIGLSPVFKTGTENGLYRLNSGIDWVAVSGISFYAHSRNPDGGEYTGTDGSGGIGQYVRPGDSSQGVLIEGCKFRFYTGNGFGNHGDGVTDIVFRRCLFLDNYKDGSHSQGMFFYKTEMILEECIFDHNGWYSQSGSDSVGQGTMFNHNTYFASVNNTTFKENIFMRGSSMNNKFTAEDGSSDILIENNLYVDGEIAIGIGSNYTNPLRFKNISIIDNVITNIGRSRPTNRTLGWGLRIEGWDGGVIDNNLIMNQPDSVVNNTYGMEFRDTMRDVNVTNNIIHNVRFAHGVILSDADGSNVSNMVFSGNKIQLAQDSGYTIDAQYDPSGKWTFTDNVYYSDQPDERQFRIEGERETFATWLDTADDNSTFGELSFPDSSRTIETYQESIGATPTIDAFIESCRAQDRYHWDSRYTADVVNSWLRAGFVN